MRSGPTDPYEILGVARSATESEIRDAFRRLAKQHHPDRNPSDPNAQRRFQELNTAHQILSDPKRRARFDQWGDSTRGGSPPAGPSGFGSIEDLFADLFGGFVAPRADRGDLQRIIDIGFVEAALGCDKTLRYERVDHCQECAGSGAAAGSQLNGCPTCGGSGQVQLGSIGLFGIGGARPCPRCAGQGRVPQSPCLRCDGTGLSLRFREIEIDIPHGIENGASQLVANAGNRVAARQPAGDLELIIRIGVHPRFQREGDDVRSEVEIPFVTSALGGKVDVETLHGPIGLSIPAGTQHGARLRLKGQGIPRRFRTGQGDHYCEVVLRVPTVASDRARELIREFQGVSDEDEGLFDRVRTWLAG